MIELQDDSFKIHGAQKRGKLLSRQQERLNVDEPLPVMDQSSLLDSSSNRPIFLDLSQQVESIVEIPKKQSDQSQQQQQQLQELNALGSGTDVFLDKMRVSEDRIRQFQNNQTPKHQGEVNFENFGRPKNFSFSGRSKQNSIQKNLEIMEESRTNHIINNYTEIGENNHGDNNKDKLGVLSKLKIGFIVRKFAKNLVKGMEGNLFSKITAEQFQKINDISFVFRSDNIPKKDRTISKIVKRSFFQSFQGDNQDAMYQSNTNKIDSFLSVLCSPKFILLPESKIIFIWNILLLLMIVYNCFECLIAIAFNESTVPQLNYLAIAAYTIECILLMNVAIFSKGQIITRRNHIFNRFLRKSFPMISLGILAICLSNISKYFKLFFLIRSFDISVIYREIENKLNISTKFKHYSELFKLVFLILSVAHAVGCFFRYVGLLELERGQKGTWISNEIYEHWVQQYVTSVYWAVVTMVTLGYGDIVPKTTYEKSFTIVIVLLSCGMFGYCLNQIGNLVSMIGRDKQVYHQNMDIVERFLKERRFNLQLQLKVRKHFEFKFKQDLQHGEQNKQLIDQMHATLKRDVCKEMYQKIITSQSLFRLHFSNEFISELCMFVQEKSLVPDEMLQKRFILVILQAGGNFQNTMLNCEKKGTMLGMFEFLAQKERITTAKSKDKSKLAFIELADFLDAIQRFPKDYETFCFIKDKVSLSGQISGYDLKCAFCQQYDHQFETCKKFQYIPNALSVLKNDKQTVHLIRGHCKRTYFHCKINTLGQLSYIAQKVEHFQQDLLEYEQHQQQSSTEQFNSLSSFSHDRSDPNLLHTPLPHELPALTKRQSNKGGIDKTTAEELVSPSIMKPRSNLKSASSKEIDSLNQNSSNLNNISTNNSNPNANTGISPYHTAKRKSTKISANDLDIVVEENQDMEQSMKQNNGNNNNNTSTKNPPYSALQNLLTNDKLPTHLRDKKLLSLIINNNNRQYAEDQQIKISFMNLMDLDRMREFRIYFPQFNYPNIMKECQQFRKKKTGRIFKQSFSNNNTNKDSLNQRRGSLSGKILDPIKLPRKSLNGSSAANVIVLQAAFNQ